MRALLILLVGCSVPDKHAPGDAGDDTTGPIDTMITEAPALFSNAGVATFSFTSNVTTAHFECRVDDGASTACTSPFAIPLGDGTHSFSVRAIDAGGISDDTPAEHLWTIDTVAPDTMLTEAPPLFDNSENVTFMFTSNEMNVTFECSLDNAAFVACRSGDLVGPIGDGQHAFAVRARDRASNLDDSPALHVWNVDTSTPDTTITTGPIGASGEATATFTFLSPDAGPGATFECLLDGGNFHSCTSPQTFSNLSEGAHTFAVRVLDAGGNVDPTPATRTWLVDLTPPDTRLDSAPSGVVGTASASFTFSSNETNVTFTCSLDGAGFAPCTSPRIAMMLAQGGHSFAVAAVDAAGHVDPSPATTSWVVDTVAPTIMLIAGPNDGDTVGPRVTFMFTISEGTTECSLDGAAAAPCASPVSYNLPAGAHSFLLRAIDAAGNATTITRSFTVACNPPDANSAAGLLHLDDISQIQTNAVGGASATLGTSDQVELADPVPIIGRFGGALAFNPAEGDLVAWPIGIVATTSDFAIELWSRPDALAGTRDILLTSGGGIAIRVTPDSATTVRISATVVGGGGVANTVTSGSLAAGIWHWVMVSLQEPTLRLWVDGVRYELADVRLNLVPALDTIQLGGNFSGAIDEVWLSQIAITTDDTALQQYCPL